MIDSPIALNVDLAYSKVPKQLVKDEPVIGSELQAELGFHLRSTALGLIEVNGKAAFTIDEPNHVVGSQHQVSPFGRQAPSYYGSADFLSCRQSFCHDRISLGHLFGYFPHSRAGFGKAASLWYTHSSPHPVIAQDYGSVRTLRTAVTRIVLSIPYRGGFAPPSRRGCQAPFILYKAQEHIHRSV